MLLDIAADQLVRYVVRHVGRAPGVVHDVDQVPDEHRPTAQRLQRPQPEGAVQHAHVQVDTAHQDPCHVPGAQDPEHLSLRVADEVDGGDGHPGVLGRAVADGFAPRVVGASAVGIVDRHRRQGWDFDLNGGWDREVRGISSRRVAGIGADDPRRGVDDQSASVPQVTGELIDPRCQEPDPGHRRSAVVLVPQVADEKGDARGWDVLVPRPRTPNEFQSEVGHRSLGSGHPRPLPRRRSSPLGRSCS